MTRLDVVFTLIALSMCVSEVAQQKMARATAAGGWWFGELGALCDLLFSTGLLVYAVWRGFQ